MFREGISPQPESIKGPKSPEELTIKVQEEVEKLIGDFTEKENTILEVEPTKKYSIKRALASITAGIMFMGIVISFAEASGVEEKPKGAEITEEAPEAEKLSAEEQKELALNLLTDLTLIPDQKIARNETQNQLMKKIVAENVIHKFCAQIKTGKLEFEKTFITPEDIKKGLEILDEHISIFADQEYGNADGETTKEESDKFNETTKKLAGFQKLESMREIYLPEESEESENPEDISSEQS